jgi:arabinoxylan arabinofuranohydrolase
MLNKAAISGRSNLLKIRENILLNAKVLVVILLGICPGISMAQNPIIQTNYTADPAPLVYNGKVYLYTSHDENGSTWFTMNDWRLYSTEDMVNWTDHGAVLSYDDFDWAKYNAWAGQCIERNGKFYFFVPVTDRDRRNGIGVAVGDSPYGPFYDPLGKPLVQNSMADIDPTVFIDEDDQAYLLWGNPVCYYVKLNEDMISYEGEIQQFPNTIESFGKRTKEDSRRPTTYEEGPWLYKRNDLYYLFYAAGPIPEHIGYSTGNSPLGPWKYQGIVMPTQGGAFTNHPGIIDFEGHTYFFYHNGALPGGGGFTRSVCVEEAEFRNDGSIVQMEMTPGIERGLKPLNPYVLNQAETIAWSEGVTSNTNGNVGVFITAMKNDAFIRVREVDFREGGPSGFTARVGTTHNGNVSMEIRIDKKDGELIGSMEIPMTGGDDRWEVRTIDVKKAKGIHDLYFVFKGKASTNIMSFDYWLFFK